MEEMLQQIQNADDREIVQVINAVIDRYNRLFPEWEVVFLSLPLGEGREPWIRETMEFLLRHEKENRDWLLRVSPCDD